MKAVQVDTHGGKEVVIVREAAIPALSENHLLIDVIAAGVNPFDWKLREGAVPLQFPATLGGDFAGVVHQVGEGVTEYASGDEVYGSALVLGAGTGAFAEVTSATPKTIAKKPTNVDFLTAATLPLVGCSAIQALIEHMKLSSGQKVLIHGGGGGIGSLAIQLAKYRGAYVITTAGTKDIDFVKELGADEVIDYTKEKFEEKVHDVDGVFDTVGGETFEKSFGVLKKGGVLVSMIGKADEEKVKQYGITVISQGTHITHEKLVTLTELVEKGVLKVNIEKVFPLDEAAEALEFQKTGHPRGKVVIHVK